MAPSDEEVSGQPLELILARNLVSIVSMPAALVDAGGRVVFFNDAAAEVIGSSFEEVGVLDPEEWNERYGPFDADGNRIPRDKLPLTLALRESRPAFGRFFFRTGTEMRPVETGALPLVGPAGYHGAVIVLWPVPDGD